MPSPKPGEKKNDFVSRCMSSAESKKTFPDTDQRLAFCINTFNKAETGRGLMSILGTLVDLLRDDFSGEDLETAGKLNPEQGEKFKEKCPPGMVRNKDGKCVAKAEFSESFEFVKTDGKLQIAYGEVYIPNVPDSHGDFMTAEEIRKAAHRFLSSGRVSSIDKEHDGENTGALVVESFIARAGDPDFIEGAWVCGVHVPSAELWQEIEKGVINGFSMAGLGIQTPTTIEINVPLSLTGRTEEVNNHGHEFVVRFDEEGNFLGGETESSGASPEKFHKHGIRQGTITEADPDDGHAHRFSFIEQIKDGPDQS